MAPVGQPLGYGFSAGRSAVAAAPAVAAEAAKDPFIGEIKQSCAAGEISEDCTGALQRYLVHLSTTGEAATGEDAATIAGYLESLGGGGANNAAPWKKGSGGGGSSAFGGYLDALSSGAAPPPSEEGVQSYIGALDRRLSGVEERVTSLEGKVDALPDQVFEKLEALQVKRQDQLSEEVKKISKSIAP